MRDRHCLICEAPICNDDPEPNYKDKVIWRAGEIVCKRRPYEKYQLVQLRINRAIKWGRFKDVGKAFTANELEQSSL